MGRLDCTCSSCKNNGIVSITKYKYNMNQATDTQTRGIDLVYYIQCRCKDIDDNTTGIACVPYAVWHSAVEIYLLYNPWKIQTVMPP